MRKSERLIYILVLLHNNKHGLDATTLAEKCGVSERTIYRDITSLSLANIPIYNDNGYKLLPDSRLPPYNFSEKEREYIIENLKPSRDNRVTERIINKIKACTHYEVQTMRSAERNNHNVCMKGARGARRAKNGYGENC